MLRVQRSTDDVTWRSQGLKNIWGSISSSPCKIDVWL